MHKSDMKKLALISAGLASMLIGLAVIGQSNIAEASIDPAVEKACYDEVKLRSPHGHRALITYAYREESSQLGIVFGGHDAQYQPGKWTQVNWSCRVNPENKKVARIELSATNGTGRMKAAATAFQ